MHNATPEKCLGLSVIRFNVTQDIYATIVTTAIINSIFSVVAVSTNFIVIVSITRSRTLHSCSNFLLVNLSVTDFLVGLLVQPLHVTRKVTELRDMHLCDLRLAYMFFGFLFNGASMLSLCLISCERYLAIVRPLTYCTLVTKPRVIYAVVVTWLFWVFVCISPFLGLQMTAFFQICFCVVVLSFVVMAITYQRVFREARRHRKEINSFQPLGEDGGAQVFRRENKVARTMTIIAGVLLICYLPQVSLILVRAVLGDSEQLIHVGDTWADTIIFINSSLNPFIYCWRNTDIRRAVIRTLNVSTQVLPRDILRVRIRKITPWSAELQTLHRSSEPRGMLVLATN